MAEYNARIRQKRDTSANWTAKDPILLDGEIIIVDIAAQTLITTQTTYHNALKAYVQSLEGSEEISAVTYGMTLPEPYLSEMNAKLAVAQAQMNAITAKLGN